MTVTISFRVREELEEFLEQRAKDKMTTRSAVARQLLSEKVREEIGDSDARSERDVFREFSDKWYRPDGKHNFAVRGPKRTHYYKTRDGARKRLMRHYVDD